MKRTERYLDLIFRRLASGQPLEPKTGLNEILHAFSLPLLIGEPDDLVSEPCDQRDENHSRGHFIPERKLMRDEGKHQNAYHHDDEKEARSASGMEITKVPYPIGHQHLTGLKGKDRLMLRSMILKDPSNLFKKRDRPQVGQEDHQSDHSIHQIEEYPACGHHGDGEP